MKKFGVFLPVSGRAAGRKTLMQAAQRAEALGYDSVWAADRLVMPWKIDTTYPYSKEATFIVPPDRPFFDTLTCLAFLAGCTETIQLGMRPSRRASPRFRSPPGNTVRTGSWWPTSWAIT